MENENEKIIYISACSQCPHGMFDTTSQKSDDFWWDEYKKGKTCGCELANLAMTSETFELYIPDWCPLEDFEDSYE